MKRRALWVALIALSASTAFAQQHIHAPQVSPHAITQETFGITDVTVDYHRPSVNKRVIFGGLVPYDVLWRAGANENTTISFSTPVKVEGQALAKGTYAFFVIPGQPQYTIVINRFTGGWGTYNYDASEDALRVRVTPQPGEMTERMLFTFDDASKDSVTLSLHWDKLRIPVKLEADTNAIVKADIAAQLRGGKHWDAQAWSEAASWTFRNGDIDTALGYVDHSISLGADVQNLRIKARILQKKGDAEGAKALLAQAGTLAPEFAAVNGFYSQMGEKKFDDAAKAIDAYVAAHPASWRALAARGDLYAAKGDEAKAREAFSKAMAAAKDESERVEVQDSINAMGATPPSK